MRFQKGISPWNKGKNKTDDKRIKGGVPKGTIPWNKGTKGIVRPNKGSFKKEHRTNIGRHFNRSLEANEAQSIRMTGQPRRGNPTKWKHTPETIEKIRQLTILTTPRGEKNYLWKGDKVGYGALHSWVRNQMGKADHCDDCGLHKIPKGMKTYFEWSNISGKYKRDIKDFKQRCKKCHETLDRGRRKILISKCRVCNLKTKTKNPLKIYCSKKCSTIFYSKRNKNICKNGLKNKKQKSR